MMNRASVQHTSLAKQATWASQGGYYDDRHGGQGRGFSGRSKSKSRAGLDQSINNALGGGNLANYGTDNASGGWGKHRFQSGMFKYATEHNGEYFMTP